MLSEVTTEVAPKVGALFSEYANLFPMIDGDARDRLKADIGAHGVRDPIVFMDGQILDGRNRYTIARELLIDYPRCDFIGRDPAAYVVSKNLHRRHLTDQQRSMIAAKLAKLTVGRPSEMAPAGGISSAAAAEMLKVSERSVERAKVVVNSGTAGLQTATVDSTVTLSAAAEIATLPAAEQERIVKSADPKVFAKVVKEIRAAKQVEKKARRTEREAELGQKQRDLPDANFGVIYADPEWKFAVYSAETGMDRSADNHYPTSATEVICARPVGSIAATDSVLFLWATSPMIKDALQVMEAWGFDYKSQCIWFKTRTGEARGSGYWFTGEHEILLVGTRGNIPAPAPGTQWRSVFEAPVGEHSAKPEIFAEMIEAYFPNLPKIELNRRGPARDGWMAWGNEAEETA